MSTPHESAPLRVLITNDDGIHASGLRWLAKAAKAGGFEVVVAAPDYEASGSSAALTAVYKEKRLAVHRVDLEDLDGVEAYSVQASPGYVVMLSVIGAFGRRPDLVLSGINRGSNTGHVVLHSGTVGAALTAANHAVPAMAVSLDTPSVDEKTASMAEYVRGAEMEGLHWATASEIARRCIPMVLRMGKDVVLNINVPNLELRSLAGVKQASLASFGHVQMAVAESAEGYVRTTVERSKDRLQPGTDVALLSRGFATLTVITTVREVPANLDIAGAFPPDDPDPDLRSGYLVPAPAI